MVKCFRNKMMIAFTEFSGGLRRRDLENGHQEISACWEDKSNRVVKGVDGLQMWGTQTSRP